MSTNTWVGDCSYWNSLPELRDKISFEMSSNNTIVYMLVFSSPGRVRSSYENWSEPRMSKTNVDVDIVFWKVATHIPPTTTLQNRFPKRNHEYSSPRRLTIWAARQLVSVGNCSCEHVETTETKKFSEESNIWKLPFWEFWKIPSFENVNSKIIGCRWYEYWFLHHFRQSRGRPHSSFRTSF